MPRTIAENIGLPHQRCSSGIAPGRTVPPPDGSRQPCDEVVAVAQLLDELRQLEEVVAVVSVAHDDEAAARGGDAALQRVAVAAARDTSTTRAPRRRGDLLRAVGAAVVGDDDLAELVHEASAGDTF